MDINVFLDDKRPCPLGFNLARSAEQCCHLLNTCTVGILSLDYNLGKNLPTGCDVVKYMIQHKVYPQRIVIHSASLKGRRMMASLLRKHKPSSVRVVIAPEPSYKNQTLPHHELNKHKARHPFT